MTRDPYELQLLGHTDAAMPRLTHYEGGDNNQRLTQCWFYALGLLGGYAKARPDIDGILMLYDYKGHMYIITRDGILRGRVLDALQSAWEGPGCEPWEHVTIVDVHDGEWQSVWRARRF